jgi:hypothetical protein
VLRWQARPLATLVLSAVTIELSWHVQELGRTVFVVFLAAAFLVRPARPLTRAVWFLAGTWQLWDSWRHPSFNTARYSHLGFGSDAGTRLIELGSRIFVERYLDIPVLFAVGILSVVFVKRHRLFWTSILTVEVGLVVLLALNTGILQGVGNVWPRRFLLVEFLCLAATAAAYHDRPGWWRRLVLGLLLAGNVWQLVDTWRWSRQPLDQEAKGNDFPLPFAHTTLDFVVPFGAVDFAHAIVREVMDGKKVILIYNLWSYEENMTNPAGVLERIYLALGHDRFMESVLVFGSQTVRYNTFPVRPMTELEPFLQQMTEPERFVSYLRTHPSDGSAFRQEAAVVLGALARRWALAEEPVPAALHDPAQTLRFRLVPDRDDSGRLRPRD